MKKHAKKESAPPARARGMFAGALRRGLCTITAAGALTLGFNAAASAQEIPVKPPVVTTHTAPKNPAAKKPVYAFSDARLKAIETRMQRTGLGRDMLAFAKDYGVNIAMSNSKKMDDNPADGFTINGTYGGKQILLNGETKSDDEIMLTLVHEIRHAWHHFVIRENTLRLDAPRSLIKDRLLEADVFAFEIHFAYEYEKATGIKLHLGNRAKPCDDDESSLCMLNSYAADRDKGASAPEAYGRLLDRMLEHVHWEEYDGDFISSQNDNWQSVIDNPGTGLAWFGVGDKGLTPDADFAAAMRRVATVGMTPGEGVSALKDWTDGDFSSLVKTSGDDEAEVKGLDGAIKKFNDARAAWNLYWADFLGRNPNIRVLPEAQPLPLPNDRPLIRDGVYPPRPAQHRGGVF